MTLLEIPWSAHAPFPLLATLQLLPALAAAVIFLARSTPLALGLGLTVGVAELGLCLHLLRTPFTDQGALYLVERWPLIGPLAYHGGVDGMGVLFLLLTGFLFLMVMVYGALVRLFRPLARFIATVLVLESLVMGQFAAVDLLWFILLSLGQTLFAGQLLRTWATTPDEAPMVTRYNQFMGVALLLLFTGAVLLGWQHAVVSQGVWRFDLPALAAISLPRTLQSVIFYLLLYGFAIRIPMFPLHAWLPMVAEHGTVASGMVILLGLKTGVYGLLRFVLPLLPDAVLQWHGYVVAFAAAGIFYSALLALMQQNLRRLVAYAVVSHTGILVIGLFSLQPQAFQGSLILTVNFGLAVSSLLFILGMVHLRTHTVVLGRLGGLFDHLPLVGIAFLLSCLSIVGMPGTPGFDAVHLMLESTIQRFGGLVTITAALGNVAAVAGLLWAFQRAFFSPARDGTHAPLPRATRVETLFLAVMMMVQVVTGFYSEPWFRLVEQTSHRLAMAYPVEGEGE